VKGYASPMPRFRVAPWMVALDVAVVLRDVWGRLESHDRRRLGEIVRRGRSMSERDKAELKRIVRKLELIDAGRQLVPIVGRRRRGRRGRR
jgi:hypothetical protein